VIKLYKLLTIAVISVLLFSVSQAFAQELTFGERAKQTVEITIEENGTAHIVHKVEGKKITQQVDVFEGTVSNLSVTDRNEDDVQYMTLEKYPLGIVLPPTSKDMVFIRYDLNDILFLIDGVWTWEYNNTAMVAIHFPNSVDIMWVNDNPVYLGQKGIRHHGGQSKLEYIIGEPVILKDAEWEGKKFTVGIRTLTDVDSFEFSQPTKSITFDITKEYPLITAIIPLELLWEPYDVYINTNQTENAEFYNNGTHVWLGLRPETVGTIGIIGTTVVPEFPLFVPLVMGISLVLVLQFRNKFNFG